MNQEETIQELKAIERLIESRKLELDLEELAILDRIKQEQQAKQLA